MVPEAQDAQALPAKPSIALGIRRCLNRVLAAVGFDDESAFEAAEVDDIAADGPLPPELGAAELARAQRLPQPLLSLGGIAPEAPAEGDPVHRAILADLAAALTRPLRGHPLPRAGEGLIARAAHRESRACADVCCAPAWPASPQAAHPLFGH